MKATGIVRKIDDLGRIVLPKELRYSLNISSGDDFDIYIENDSIVLKKFSKLVSLKEKLLKLLSIFKKNIDFEIIITTKDKILMNSEKILSEFHSIISERKMYINNNKGFFKISENCVIEGNFVILPIILNSDLIGSIIAYGKEDTEYMLRFCNILLFLIKSEIV